MLVKIQHGVNLLVHKINREYLAGEYSRLAKIKMLNFEDHSLYL